MSRIQQILSRADREGTTAGLTWPASPAGPRYSPKLPTDSEPEVVNGAAWPSSPLGGTRFALVDTESPSVPSRPPSDATLHAHLVAALQPESPVARQYQRLRARLEALEGGSRRQIVAVTSPIRGDGKTLTGCNLAFTLAQDVDCRTLVIDAHLRRPRIHTLLGLARAPGLVDVVAGATPFDRSVVTLAGYRLHVLTAGTATGQRAGLLGSTAMQRLIEEIRHRFDRVVIDTASAESAEARALERWIDGVLLVVRAGRTKAPDIDHALTRVPAAKLIGMVLNDCRSSNESTELEDADVSA